MPGTVNFRIEGLAQLERAMTELGGRSAIRIGHSGLSVGSNVIVKLAKAKVPVRTGELRRSIARRRVRRQSQPGVLKWIIGVERPRSRIFHLVEFGTVKMAARPFMRPALDEGAGTALMTMAVRMARTLGSEARRLAR